MRLVGTRNVWDEGFSRCPADRTPSITCRNRSLFNQAMGQGTVAASSTATTPIPRARIGVTTRPRIQGLTTSWSCRAHPTCQACIIGRNLSPWEAGRPAPPRPAAHAGAHGPLTCPKANPGLLRWPRCSAARLLPFNNRLRFMNRPRYSCIGPRRGRHSELRSEGWFQSQVTPRAE